MDRVKLFIDIATKNAGYISWGKNQLSAVGKQK